MDRNDITNLEKLLLEKVGKVKEGEIGDAKLIPGGPPKMKKPEEYINQGNENKTKAVKEGKIPPQLAKFVKKKKENANEDSSSDDEGGSKPKKGKIPPQLAKFVKKKKTLNKESYMLPKSTFDDLFKNTILEQDEIMGDEMDMEANVADDIDTDDTTEEVDVATRLEMVLDDLKSVIDEIRGEEGGEEESEDMFEEEPYGEAVVSEPEPRPLSDAGGKSLMGKGSIKAGGTIRAGGSAQAGKITSDPEPKPLPNKGQALMGKGSMKVSAPKIRPGASIFE